MNDAYEKLKSACFTGHRSQKLPWRFNENDERFAAMKETLRAEILKAVRGGFKIFYCGMAIGFDTACAETVLELKAEYPELKLIGALPCEKQEARWSAKDRKKYAELLTRLDGVRRIYGEYTAECMMERNRFMVDNSQLLIALYNGRAGGTKSTIEYAQRQGLDVVIIEP